MVDAVVQLCIIVYLVLAVLVTTPGSKLKFPFLFFHGGIRQYFFEKLINVGHRRVERCQNKGLFRGIPQCLIHGVKVELSEAVPGFFLLVNPLVTIEARGVIVGEL